MDIRLSNARTQYIHHQQNRSKMSPQKIFLPIKKFDSALCVCVWSNEDEEWEAVNAVEEQSRYVFSEKELQEFLLVERTRIDIETKSLKQAFLIALKVLRNMLKTEKLELGLKKADELIAELEKDLSPLNPSQ